jgi:hypothetical protein
MYISLLLLSSLISNVCCFFIVHQVLALKRLSKEMVVFKNQLSHIQTERDVLGQQVCFIVYYWFVVDIVRFFLKKIRKINGSCIVITRFK